MSTRLPVRSLVVGTVVLAACQAVTRPVGEVPQGAAAAQPAAAVEPGAPLDVAVLTGEGVVYVDGANPERRRLRYVDGQLSGNDTCFIKIGNKLNYKVPPLYINGQPVGFC